MNSRRAGLLAACAVAGVAITAATANATPETAAPQVTYHATLSGDSVVVTLDHGTFATPQADSVVVRDSSGTTLDALPLAYTLDNQKLPLRQTITDDGHALRLTPDLATVDRATLKPVADLKPVASPLENQLAMNDLINAASIGTSVGSLVGTAIGAVLGAGVGFALAGASCVVLSLGCVVAVLPIVSLVAGVGGLAGLVIGGGPTIAYALFQYVTTLNAAPGQSIYAPNLQGKPGIPAAPAAEN
ncbi:hypothetical protein ACFYUD_11670 [Nocardia tengchongensis]|uniref:hypothetical protein n=1 Tax=Nocardia tengchongensis TaxID=2055889 RepID=UPI0036B08CE5